MVREGGSSTSCEALLKMDVRAGNSGTKTWRVGTSPTMTGGITAHRPVSRKFPSAPHMKAKDPSGRTGNFRSQ